VIGLVNVEFCCRLEGQQKLIVIVIKRMPDATRETLQQLAENLLCFLLLELAPIHKIQQNAPDGRMELFE